MVPNNYTLGVSISSSQGVVSYEDVLQKSSGRRGLNTRIEVKGIDNSFFHLIWQQGKLQVCSIRQHCKACYVLKDL